jgi:hypothetical protein
MVQRLTHSKTFVNAGGPATLLKRKSKEEARGEWQYDCTQSRAIATTRWPNHEP